MFGTCILISFGPAWIWCFLIHLFWRKEHLPPEVFTLSRFFRIFLFFPEQTDIIWQDSGVN